MITVYRRPDGSSDIDAAVNYYDFENTVFTLGATNLLNEEPPFAYHDFMGFAVNVHSGQGQFAYLRASYKL